MRTKDTPTTSGAVAVSTFACRSRTRCGPASDIVAARLSAVFTVPDTSPTFLVPVTATRFVKTTNGLALVDGMIRQVDVNKPSSAKAFVGLPVDLTKTLIELPTKIVQLRLKLINEEETLAARERALAEEARTRQETERTRRRALADAADSALADAHTAERALATARAKPTPDPAEIVRLEREVEVLRRKANRAAVDAGLRRPFAGR